MASSATTDQDTAANGRAATDARASATTRIVLNRLFRGEAPLPVRLWTGESLPAGSDSRPAGDEWPTLVLNHPGALRRMFWPPGELTLAEAYLRGDFDLEGDILALQAMAGRLEGYRAADWLALARPVLALPRTDPDPLYLAGRQRARLSGRRHSRARDRQAVTYHYDAGNDFYRLFLGRWLAYSCAYFARPDLDLDAAQEAKFEHICRKLRLRPGERLLDIGCGWGGLVIYAARQYGVQARGITLSRPQVAYAQAWLEREGLAGQARVALRDYREVDEAPFDKIVSVGMAEHVGLAKLPAYFEAAFRLLRPGGLFLNHAIGTARLRPAGWLARKIFQRGQFVQRYVFPDGELLPIHTVLGAAAAAGFEVRDVENLREHYALTLRRWLANLQQRRSEAVALKDERTYRTWRLYMAASVWGFEGGGINIFQSLLSRGRAGEASLPLTRADVYRP